MQNTEYIPWQCGGDPCQRLSLLQVVVESPISGNCLLQE